jgi:hypothetical protein
VVVFLSAGGDLLVEVFQSAAVVIDRVKVAGSCVNLGKNGDKPAVGAITQSQKADFSRNYGGPPRRLPARRATKARSTRR